MIIGSGLQMQADLNGALSQVHRKKVTPHQRRSRARRMSRFGRLVGDTNGLESIPARLFLSKHASRRLRAAALPSNGSDKVAPSPRTSSKSTMLSLSFKERSANAIVTAFDSANAFASTDREPAMRRTVYALPRSRFHLGDWRNSSKLSRVRRNVTSIPSVERLIAQPSKSSAL